jgi:hypothetical protein
MFGRRDSLRELIAEMREESRRRGEEFKEESERQWEETREFNREILLRNEKVYTSMIAQLEKNTAQVHSNTEETRAQTRALLRLIDRFDEPRGPAVA